MFTGYFFGFPKYLAGLIVYFVGDFLLGIKSDQGEDGKQWQK
jgi:hypothetical protein